MKSFQPYELKEDELSWTLKRTWHYGVFVLNIAWEEKQKNTVAFVLMKAIQLYLLIFMYKTII